jgi:8-amino-7-oxononanoate synthase
VLVEGVYSMDGDICDLPAARALADEFKGILILDEAHALGTIGKTGRGCEEHYEY